MSDIFIEFTNNLINMENKKEFDKWNNNKKSLNDRDFSRICCKNKQIWICKIGENIGNELSKSSPFIRPVLIINSFLGGDLILILPLTTKYSKNYDNFLFKLNKEIGLDFDSYVVLNQIKVISKRRLIKRVVDSIDANIYYLIIKKLKENIKI